MHPLRIEELWIYPVKSLAGIRLQEAGLTPLGLAWDRHWMIVDSSGTFVTQRKLPQMALIRTALSATHLQLSAGAQQLEIALAVPASAETGTASVWGDVCAVLDEGDAAAAWLTTQLQSRSPLRLVRMAEHFRRPQSAPERFGAATTRFADAAPCLLTNQASLQALNAALQAQGLTPVDMRRFRPNIVVSGLSAFAEQHTPSLHHEDCTLLLCDPSSRCVITTIDPDTGVKDPAQEPFKTLTRLNPMPAKAHVPAFGMNTTVAATTPAGFTLACGMELRAAPR